MSNKASVGEWAPKFQLGNVAIHLHLLPTGKVLYWGRRSQPVNNMKFTSLNEHKTHAYLLDVDTLKSQRTRTDPENEDELSVNLFCSGHTFQADGTLLVLGGHVLDSFGEDQTCVYDPFNDSWSAKPAMIQGRWYPTAITLSDGRGLVVSGSSADIQNPVINLVPQIWDGSKGTWDMVQTPQLDIFSLYPRLYNAPNGKIFMAGPLARSRFLDLNANKGHGEWSSEENSPRRAAGQREYAASATYDIGKIIYVGGGGGDNHRPTNFAEVIDLNGPYPQWRRTHDIGKGRRHSFATTLPDGTVLVTGGTNGLGFNDLRKKAPTHEPELWDPVTEKWSVMAAEDDDRCYHHTALLLPDGRVLSSGGGEYAPDNGKIPNAPKDTIVTAQIFSPPYLFKGKRPTVTGVPVDIDYKKQFKVSVGQNDKIRKVSFTRLGSVTHSHNMNQSFQFLPFTANGTEITIDAPKDPSTAPPGHYMLFLVSEEGVPSVAPIVLLKPDFTPLPLPPQLPVSAPQNADLKLNVGVSLDMRNEEVCKEHHGPAVIVGLTPTCPYGLGPCWGGAYEALNNIKDIKTVLPRPNQAASIAFVFLHDEHKLPNITEWREQLFELDSGTYTLRGIEITLTGLVTEHDGELRLKLHDSTDDSYVVLDQFKAESKIEWDNVAKVSEPVTQEEAVAYTQLFKAIVAHCEIDGLKLQVTGRLQQDGDKYSLDVKSFVELTAPA